MKKTILLLFIVLTIICCTSKSESEIALFNDIFFVLTDEEEIISLDAKKKEDFHSYFDNKSIQIPLFRCIKTDNYLIYLGIPINTSINKLAEFKLNHTNNHSFFESDSSSYFYIAHQNEDNYITEYSIAFDNNLIYILTVSNSRELSDSLFNKKTLSKRFNQY